MNRKQIDKLKIDLNYARETLLEMIDTPTNRKEVALKSGQSFSYLSDFYADRKYMSDTRVIKILDKVVE